MRVGIAAVAAAGFATAALLVGPSPGASAAPFAGDVEIGDGRSLYLECRGSGSPTVVLEAGLRSRGDFWSTKAGPGQPLTVFGRVSKLTRVCEYDRPGTTLGSDEVSRSDPVPMPRTPADAVADLHALIRAAPIEGPIVLVGHSTGGLIIRLYASTFPNRVVGMVEVDALNERIQRRMTAEHFAQYYELNAGSLPGLEDYPELEVIDFYRGFAQMRRAQRQSPLAPIPLIVISKRRPFVLPEELGKAFAADVESAWAAGQRWLAGLLGSARHWIARQSGHYVMFDQPRIVVRAIRAVLFESVAE